MWRNKYVLTFLLLCIMSIASFVIIKTGNANNLQKKNYVIVTSFYPIYIAALNITDGIDDVEVYNLTNNSTGCVHDYQLSSKDLKLLDKADIVIVNGAGMENFLEDIINYYEELYVVTATEGVELLSEVTEEDKSEEIHDNSAHKHSENEFNAHSWMDVSLYIQEVENITEALVEQDPHHKVQYEANFEKYKKKLNKLSEQAMDINHSILTRGQKPNEYGVVLFHEAFEYLEKLCNFHIEEVVDMDENTALSAAQISNIIDKANSGNVQFIIADENTGRAAAEAVKGECSVKVLYLDPLTTGEDDKDSYINGMGRNLEILKEAFVK